MAALDSGIVNSRSGMRGFYATSMGGKRRQQRFIGKNVYPLNESTGSRGNPGFFPGTFPAFRPARVTCSKRLSRANSFGSLGSPSGSPSDSIER